MGKTILKKKFRKNMPINLIKTNQRLHEKRTWLALHQIFGNFKYYSHDDLYQEYQRTGVQFHKLASEFFIGHHIIDLLWKTRKIST